VKLVQLIAWMMLGGLTVSGATVTELHHNQSLARAFGQNSATVWLIENGTASQRINRAWFESLLAEAIERDGLNRQLETDLRGGNGLAAVAVRDAMLGAGFSPQAAQHAIMGSVSGGDFPHWSALLQPHAITPLAGYFLNGDADADSVARALTVWPSPRQKLPDPVYQIALRATGLTAPRPPADITEVWEYTRRICGAFNGGANQVIRHTYPANGAYATFWRTVLARFALAGEYRRRLSAARLAGNLWSVPLQESINSEAGLQFLKNYFQHHATARANHLRQTLGANVTVSDWQVWLRDNLAAQPELAGYFFWLMTRPAEAASLNTRAALVQTLASHPPTVRIFLEQFNTLGGGWFNTFAASHAWAECPLRAAGKPEGIHQIYRAGRLTDRDLLAFGLAVSRHLAADDDAWAELWHTPDFSPALRSIFLDALGVAPELAPAWAELLRGHALQSATAFAAANRDLADLDPYLARGAVSDRLDFARRFKSFAQTTNTVSDDINREIILRDSLKNIYLQAWQNNPAGFWELYRRLTALPKLEFVTQKIAQVIAANRVADLVAGQIAANHLDTVSVCSAVLVRLFKNPETKLALCQKIENSSPLGSLHELRAGAMINALALPTLKTNSSGLLTAANADVDHLPVWIASHPKEAMELHRNLGLAVSGYQAAWEQSVASLVLYSGKAPLLMSAAIVSDPALTMAWREAFNAEVAANPEFLKWLVPTLARQTANSLDAEARLRAILQSIQNALLDERLLWENIIAFPDGGLGELINP
jgi:hypothetical protein